MSKVVTKLTVGDLAEAIADESGESKAAVERHIRAGFDEITAALAEGIEVTIPGFGKFVPHEQAARTARNPANGETINVPAKTVPKFKAGKTLKDAVATG